jgi:hypothetical protein
MRRHVGTAILFLALVNARGAIADPEECRDAIDQYKSARADVADAVRKYASCVADDDGHDDCSSEFRKLRSAQDDFESAVSEYEKECQ